MSEFDRLNSFLPIDTLGVATATRSQGSSTVAEMTGTTFDAVRAEILEHKDAHCGFDICASCTNMVPGEGNSQADLMLIGEAPGKNEDEQGRPFVGAAGKMLDQLLDSIELSRESVFITNVLKCRPPGNRDPLPAEAEHHWPWLEQQIDAIQPSVIVLLGRHALKRFLPTSQISDVHGQSQTISGQRYLPVYHPAAALYNGSLRDVLFKDFAVIPQLVAQVRSS